MDIGEKEEEKQAAGVSFAPRGNGRERRTTTRTIGKQKTSPSRILD
jgi:hypothetical protein